MAALAHGLLRSSSPAADAVLVQSPREIRLTFNEQPEPNFTGVRLIGPEGEIALEPVRFLPEHVVVAGIRAALTSGTYRVEWRTAGDDGHPVSGQLAFVVATDPSDSAAIAGAAVDSARDGLPPGATAGSIPGGTGVPALGGDAQADPFAAFGAILRWLTLVAAIASIGAVAFRYTILARVSLEVDRDIRTGYLPDAELGAAKVGMVAAALITLAAMARLLLQSLAVHGPEAMFDLTRLTATVGDTNWGLAWTVQVAGAVVAMAAFLTVRSGRSAAWLVAALSSGMIAVGLALASHATIVPRLSGLSVSANMVHTLAAAGWLGNLLIVFAVGLPLAWRLDRDDRWTVVRDVVHAFSPAALAFGGVAAATGIFMAWTHVGSFAALTGTDYGNVLMLKIGLLSLTAITGAYNWLRVRPSLGDQTGARRLRRTAGTELAIATLVIAVTAVLVALPMPRLQ